jgi:transposase-like protein
VIGRLTVQWQAEREAFMARSLADRDYVYVWADGVHLNVRLAEERLCTLVIIGVRTDDIEALLAFYDFPAEHWVHLKTTNPVESTFATVRLRTRVTKGPGSKQAGLAMAFKLLEAAEQRWRAVNGPHLVALVRAGAVFQKGVLIARPGQDQEAAA